MINDIKINEHSWIRFTYVNYKGETSTRNAIVKEVFFGSNKWHNEPQFLIKAWDLEKDDIRVFAMKDMTNIIELG